MARKGTKSRKGEPVVPGGVIWTRCRLRLTLQFEAWHGVSLGSCPCRDSGSVPESLEGWAIDKAMLDLVAEEGFRSDYLERREELDHLGPSRSGRIAFNLAIDAQWERIERAALAMLELKLPENGPGN